jgi:predicted nucleic acid-binding Zn finger protein
MDVVMKEEIITVLKEIQRKQSISGATLIALNRLCGNRFWRALQAVSNNLVKHYHFKPSGREAWIVVGKNRDYRVLSEIYCDCEDFYVNVIVKRRAEFCYHILAKIIAEALGAFAEIEEDDMMHDSLQKEWDAIPKPRLSNKTQKEAKP